MSGKQSQYDIGLDKTPANFVALTPLSFLARTAAVYPDLTSTVYEGRVFTWSETYARCRRFASYLAGQNIGYGDTVAAMLPNIPAMNELHFAVPMAGAVLNALNIRLDAESIAFMLEHSEAKVLLTDREFAGVIDKALALLGDRRPFVIEVEDDEAPAGKPGRDGQRSDADAAFLEHAHHHVEAAPLDAEQSISGYRHIVEVELAHLRGTLAQLVFFGPARDAGGVAVDDENAHAALAGLRIGTRQDESDVGDRCVVDP